MFLMLTDSYIGQENMMYHQNKEFIYMFWNVRVITPLLMSFLGQTEFLIRERAFIFFCWYWKPVLKSLCVNYYNSFFCCFSANVHVSLSDWVPVLKDVDYFRKYFKLNNWVIPSSKGNRIKNESWAWGTNKGDGSLLSTPKVFAPWLLPVWQICSFFSTHGIVM